MTGVVAIHPVVLHRQRLAPRRVPEKVAQMRLVNLQLFLFQRFPLGGGADQNVVARDAAGLTPNHGSHPGLRGRPLVHARGRNKLCVGREGVVGQGQCGSKRTGDKSEAPVRPATPISDAPPRDPPGWNGSDTRQKTDRATYGTQVVVTRHAAARGKRGPRGPGRRA